MPGSTLPIRRLLLLLPLTFLGLFYFYPLAKILLLSLRPEGAVAGLGRLVQSPVYLGILWFTCWQAALSTLVTLVLALPGAFVLARYRFRGKKQLEALMTVPFVLPTVVTAAAFQALLGKGGLVNTWLMATFPLTEPPLDLDQSLWFFLLAHIFYNYPLVVRIVGGFWANLNPDLTGAARLLGASPWQAFSRITLPLLMPALLSAALLVFIFCFTSFGVVLILGGPQYATLEVEIYRQSVQLFNLPMAAALALVQLSVNFLLMWLHARLGMKIPLPFHGQPSAVAASPATSLGSRLALGANLTVMAVLLLSPLAALVVRSLTGRTGATLAYYTALFSTPPRSVFFVEPITAVVNSLGFALAAMGLAVALGLIAAVFLAASRGRAAAFWDALIMLPLATSAVTLGFGYIITLNRPPLNLRDSLALIPIAHALVAFPFVVRCILPGLRQIPQTLREAAALLGATPLQVLRWVDLPIAGRAILVGAVFAFSISMGEFGASAFVARPQTLTMPVAIFRFLGQPGDLNYGQAMAMSTLLMLVTSCAFWLLGRLDRPPARPKP